MDSQNIQISTSWRFLIIVIWPTPCIGHVSSSILCLCFVFHPMINIFFFLFRNSFYSIITTKCTGVWLSGGCPRKLVFLENNNLRNIEILLCSWISGCLPSLWKFGWYKVYFDRNLSRVWLHARLWAGM